MPDSTAKAGEQYRIYTPHKAGLPNMREYFKELWRRRDFALELSRTNMRAANTNTVLGQAWLVINPLLLAAVYYLLVVVIRGPNGGEVDFPQIASGLFLFFYLTGSITACATSITNAGSLILNMNFPKMLLIFSNVYLAFRRFLPTLVVYAVIHIYYRVPWTLQLLWIPVVIFSVTIMAMGIGALVSTWHVYFRDTSQFLPYFIRLWLYASPVLYSAEEFLTSTIGRRLGSFSPANPMFAPLGVWSDALHGVQPPWLYVGIMFAWAFGLLIVGVLYFISREREFAVRL